MVFDNTDRRARKITYGATAKKLVRFGLPLGLSNSLSTFVGQIVNLIILRFVQLVRVWSVQRRSSAKRPDEFDQRSAEFHDISNLFKNKGLSRSRDTCGPSIDNPSDILQ